MLDIILNYTGNLFYNYDNDEEKLSKVLFSYCYKRSLIFTKTKYLKDISELEIGNNIEISNNDIRDMDIFADIDIDNFEVDFLNKMNYLLEYGDKNYVKTLKKIYCLTDNEYNEIINKIKIKIKAATV